MLDDQDRIAALERRIVSLEGRLGPIKAAASLADSPYQRILLAKRDADDPTKWVEHIVNNGAIGEFTAGRRCTNADGPAAIIDPGDSDGDFAFLMEVTDKNAGATVTRFVLITGSTAGMKDLRLNADGTWVQVTYVESPTEADWVNKIQVGPQCPT